MKEYTDNVLELNDGLLFYEKVGKSGRALKLARFCKQWLLYFIKTV